MAGLKDLDPQLVRQLLETFRVQMDERLQAITEGLLTLERTPSLEARLPLLESMFRAVHNIKGAAWGVGLEGCADLAHGVEDLFAAWKQGVLEIQSSAIDLCLSALDVFPALAESESLGQDMDEHARHLLQRLRNTARGSVPDALPEPAPAAATPTPIRPAASADSVRLPVERLDRIADLAEELQTIKIRLDDHHAGSHTLAQLAHHLRHRLERQASPNPRPLRGTGCRANPAPEWLQDCLDLATELEQLAQRQYQAVRASASLLRPVTSALMENAHALRLVPAATLLAPLTRSVRDLAREIGKDALLNLSGGYIEMDRAILDALRDPITHLLRNAIDHGIEMPAQRRALGKPHAGRIRIQLTRQGGMVRVTVMDDGAGIDPEFIRKQALKRGISNPDSLSGMARAELFELLFRPGFSTREEVSLLSGRGVGLDVVRVKLQAMHGRVSVESMPGQGTRFHLDLPLTLAGEHGLLVQAGGRRLAIPNQYVTRLLELMPDAIGELEASQVLYLGQEPVPLRDLAVLLRLGETDPPPAGEPIQVVVINRGWERIALRVEHILGEREMVVKPLAPPLDRMPLFAGGTMGRDGDIILVLETAGLMQAALASASGGRVVRRAEAQRSAARILVVDDSITTRTLEESVLTSAGYRVSVAADGEAAWERLRHDHFELVITDVEMPGMDGFELTRRIKQDSRLGSLPVIIVTSLSNEEDRRRGMDVRADAYIVKSRFESRELLEVVGQLL